MNKCMYLMIIIVLFSGCGSSSINGKREPNSTDKYSIKNQRIKPFSSDGCSLFPDGIVGMDKSLWQGCCLIHDIDYWVGGTEKEKNESDKRLEQCVGLVANDLLGSMMFQGVKLGGRPELPTHFRWGYGWDYGESEEPFCEVGDDIKVLAGIEFEKYLKSNALVSELDGLKAVYRSNKKLIPQKIRPFIEASMQEICHEFRDFSDDKMERLKKMSAGDMMDLFFCPLPEMGERIHSSRYWDLLQTNPTKFDWSKYVTDKKITITHDYWDVIWAYGMDVKQAFNELNPLMKKMLAPLVSIKKEFPRTFLQNDRKYGWSSFGHTEKMPNFIPTRNYVYQTENQTFFEDVSGDKIDPLIMKYVDEPWYHFLKIKSNGFIDYFRFLTKDIVIARGEIGKYNPQDDLFPQDSRPYFFQQFWMQRKNQEVVVDLSKGTQFISIPMIRHLWDSSKVTNPDLSKSNWQADLLLNSKIVNNYAGLTFASDKSTFSVNKSILGLPSMEINKKWYDLKVNDEGIVTIGRFKDGNQLQLKQVEDGIPLMVGKICMDSDNFLMVKKYSKEIPLDIQTWHMSQYMEYPEGKKLFCNYFLVH